jgi:hypothetical protein
LTWSEYRGESDDKNVNRTKKEEIVIRLNGNINMKKYSEKKCAIE